MEQFCKTLPKIELHAHLNGSLSANTLLSLGCLENNVREYQKLADLLTKKSRMLDECFQLFQVAHQVTNNAQAVYAATQSVIKEFNDDGVIYLELRTTPREEVGMTRNEYIEAVVKAIKETAKKLPIIVKLILCLDRKFDDAQNQKLMDIIIEQFRKDPDIIVGVDLCGNPKLGCFPKMAFIEARKAGLKVTLHCGEVKGHNEEIVMLEFGPDRFGHGTFLHIDERIFNIIKSRKIPLEICLTSNVITESVDKYSNHHILKWMAHHLPFTLCTDDKGVFLSNLSNEYLLANKYYNLSKQELYDINFTGIDYIFADDAIKNCLRNTFIEWKERNMKNSNELLNQ